MFRRRFVPHLVPATESDAQALAAVIGAIKANAKPEQIVAANIRVPDEPVNKACDEAVDADALHAIPMEVLERLNRARPEKIIPAVVPLILERSREQVRAFEKTEEEYEREADAVMETARLDPRLEVIEPEHFTWRTLDGREMVRLLRKVRRRADDGVMILVPSGPYVRGSARNDDEWPPRWIFEDAFFIDETPVTNAQFGRFLAEANYQWKHAPGLPVAKDDHPVVNVSWRDAAAFADWLDTTPRAGQENWRTRLPSESQWEKAARGDDQRVYPWGNEEPGEGASARANYGGAEIGTTSSVRRFATGRSPFGLFDAAGNVWEWCGDQYNSEFYFESVQHNPVNKVSVGGSRVVRGGSWDGVAWFLRASSRHYSRSDARYDYYGFRMSLSLVAAGAPVF
ncbi:MAG: SUMF1/EgtB/PvdO family nonheme iron enzyme [Planctomycetes bacterium]|nr:SUMF1/EgtB/PvdO family nonheme iron enzyme [Planctomycetota bacterium]